MPDETDELHGKRFGKEEQLEILRKLGEGGMGAVYLAQDHKYGRKVAMKFLRMDGYVDREVISRFKREGRKFGRLRHANIVQVYSLGREQGRIYIASEFVEGKNLYELLSRDGAFPVERALSVCRDVAGGLAEAHRQLVIHRDLKPENVMIRDVDNVVKILDFGIAKDLDASIALTKHGAYIGTPAYSAPEQIRGDEIDGRTDIFALGVILYELLTGQVAFKGRHTTDVLKATLRDHPIPVSKLNESVTTPVAKLIDRMIQKNPKRRPSDMDEVIAGIDKVLEALQSGCSAEDQEGIRALLKRIFQPPRNS